MAYVPLHFPRSESMARFTSLRPIPQVDARSAVASRLIIALFSGVSSRWMATRRTKVARGLHRSCLVSLISNLARPMR